MPMTFCHFGGRMRSTQEDKLMEALEKKVKRSEPTFIESLVIDGNFLLHLLTDIPTTFGKIFTFTFRKIERDKFHITGPNQTRPVNFLGSLRNDDFKRS